MIAELCRRRDLVSDHARIPFNRPYFTGRERTYIDEVLASRNISGDGVFAHRCEALMQQRFGAANVQLTTSCTSALEIAALLSELEPGDEVIMPSYTFVSTANAFRLRRAKVKFVDIRRDTLNIDESKIEAVIGPRTRAIAPVHYAGVGCEMDAIMAIAGKYGLRVIEDAAQGVNATYKGRYLGTIGDMGCYSFHESKNFVAGEGGAFLTNDRDLARRAEIIREKGTNRSQFFRGEVDKYTWMDIGSSYIASDLLAALLLAQLEAMDEITALRSRAYGRYAMALAPLVDAGTIEIQSIPQHCATNFHLFYILVEDLHTRTRLIEHLKQQGIHAVFHYVPLHTAPVGEEMGYRAGMLPTTEYCADRVLRLPLYAGLQDGEVDRITDAVRCFFGG
jgi:dTDP-4-amino-4,6-dideoxygalactose transaminase